MLGVGLAKRERQFDRGARESLPPLLEHPLPEEWVFLNGDGGRWWLSLAKNRAMAAAARCDPTPNPQLLLSVVFHHHPTRHYEWLYPLKLKIVPCLRAEQHSGNRRRVQQRRVKVNPPNGRASTKEEGGGASLGRGTVVVVLATASSLPIAGGWLPLTLAALSRPSLSAAAAAALGMLMHVCWHKGGAGRGGCGGGGTMVPYDGRYSYFLQLSRVLCKFSTL